MLADDAMRDQTAEMCYYNHVTDYESKCTMHQYLKGNKNSDKPTPHRPHFHEAMHDCTEIPSFISNT